MEDRNSRTRFTPEFREQAVRLVLEHERDPPVYSSARQREEVLDR